MRKWLILAAVAVAVYLVWSKFSVGAKLRSL